MSPFRGTACGLRWSGFARPGGQGPMGDRAAVIEGGAGILVVVADGAGNSRSGARAAEAVVALARARMRPDGAPDAWALQELLLEADEAALRTGGETTALLAFFREGTVACAAAGDTVLVLPGAEVFPRPRTRHRLGSGRADVRVHTCAVDGPSLVVTDGALACLSLAEMGAAAHDVEALAGWAARSVEARARLVGDDATVVGIGSEGSGR